MPKLRIFFTGIVVVMAVASVLLERRAQAKFRENEAVLRQQERQLTELETENQRLSDLIAQAKTNRAPQVDRTAELAQLRAKVEVLRNQANQLAKGVAEIRRLTGAQYLSMSQSNLPEHNHILANTMTMSPDTKNGKINDARALMAALRRYTDANQGLFPLNLNQVDPYLAKASGSDSPLTGTNDFEVAFHGSQNDLTNIPPLTVALIRERQPWQTPDGKWARTYAFDDDIALIVGESDDNFQSWDAQHVVPSPAAGQ